MPAEAEPRAPSGLRLRRYLPLLGLLLLAFLLSRFDLRAIGAAFARVRVSSLALCAGLFSLNLGLKSLRWQRMLQAQRIRLPARAAIAGFFSSQFYGQVTLGRLGELYRAEVLTERGVPLGTALSSCIYDRLLDVAVVLVAGAALSAGVVGNARAAAASAVSMVVLLVIGVAVVRAPQLAAIGPVVRLRGWLAGRRGTRGLLGMVGQLVSGLGPLLRPAFLAEAVAWTLVAWLCYFSSLWSLAGGLQVVASRTALTASSALGALSALLPITISGLGARELISIQVLGLEGVPAPSALVLSLLHMSIMTASSIGLGAIGLSARARQQRAYRRAESEVEPHRPS